MRILFVIISIFCLVNCNSNFKSFVFNKGLQKQLIVAQCPPDLGSSFNGDRIVGYIPHFQFLNGTSMSDVQTSVQICHRNFEILDITWNVTDTQMISNYTKCNDPLFLQDAVQVFLGDPKDNVFMKQYIDIEVNPQGALYGAIVQNNNNSCTGLTNQMLNCNRSGIYYSAEMLSFGYKANAQIPVKLITGTQKTQHLKGNFFRINYSNSEKTSYSCWKPTLTETPCFHVPSSFRDIILA